MTSLTLDPSPSPMHAGGAAPQGALDRGLHHHLQRARGGHRPTAGTIASSSAPDRLRPGLDRGGPLRGGGGVAVRRPGPAPTGKGGDAGDRVLLRPGRPRHVDAIRARPGPPSRNTPRSGSPWPAVSLLIMPVPVLVRTPHRPASWALLLRWPIPSNTCAPTSPPCCW
ncbi:hypothetical protein QJS66_19415 [Kocuria rhizophila]|nr:hypothetical protein QJS66_19415 [Kocuria rhizophila]